METIKKNLPLILALILFLAMGAGLLFQSRSIEALKQQSDKEKEAAITAVEDRYKDSIRLSNERIKGWEAKYDSVTSYKSIVKQAIKINKKKSDEKVIHILTANDSIFRFISDSTLRANGFNR